VCVCVFACAAKVCEFGLHTHRYSEYIVAMLFLMQLTQVWP